MNELAAGTGASDTDQPVEAPPGGGQEIFGCRRAKGVQEGEALQASLYEEIGRLKMELD